jgi:hypothetical protein
MDIEISMDIDMEYRDILRKGPKSEHKIHLGFLYAIHII